MKRLTAYSETESRTQQSQDGAELLTECSPSFSNGNGGPNWRFSAPGWSVYTPLTHSVTMAALPCPACLSATKPAVTGSHAPPLRPTPRAYHAPLARAIFEKRLNEAWSTRSLMRQARTASRARNQLNKSVHSHDEHDASRTSSLAVPRSVSTSEVAV